MELFEGKRFTFVSRLLKKVYNEVTIANLALYTTINNQFEHLHGGFEQKFCPGGERERGGDLHKPNLHNVQAVVIVNFLNALMSQQSQNRLVRTKV